MRIDYNIKDKFDFGLLVPALTLFLIGLAAIYSSTANNPAASGNFEKQIIWGIISLIVFFITYSIPTNFFKTSSLPSYVVALLFLIIVVAVGRQISGSKSWLTFGVLGFQPSEIAKIATIFALASYLSRNNSDIDSFKDIFFTILIGLLPVLLILLQPDLGTALVFIGMLLAVIFWKGISTFSLFMVLSPGIVAVASLFGFYYFLFSLVAIVITLFFLKKIYFLVVPFSH